jgi:prepilin-type N-terminal cleavage/methylation domain-containing protein
MRNSIRGAHGFSLVEMLIAVALLLMIMATVFAALSPAQGAFQIEPERADLQQRLRVAADVLRRDLSGAGGGSYQGRHSGALDGFFPAVLPFRQGQRSADPPGTFRPDTLTLLSVSPDAAQTTIAEPMLAQAGTVRVNLDPGCPLGDAACGFKTGAAVVVFDDDGRHDLFTVTGVQGDQLNLQHDFRDSPVSYARDTRIATAVVRTYYLKADAAADAFQLMRYDGADGPDIPVVDHVVGLTFEYFGAREAPRMTKPRSEANGPWTTYGPAPPLPDVETLQYPHGENCLFGSDGSSMPSPRLTDLGSAAEGLVRLDASELTDGPWCPDALDPNRFDADLFRIRSVVTTLRVESAVAAFRGPAGPLFARGGSSMDGHRFLPDQEIRFAVSPRNLNLRP